MATQTYVYLTEYNIYLTEYNIYPPHFHEITCKTQSYKLQTKSLLKLQLGPEQSMRHV